MGLRSAPKNLSFQILGGTRSLEEGDDEFLFHPSISRQTQNDAEESNSLLSQDISNRKRRNHRGSRKKRKEKQTTKAIECSIPEDAIVEKRVDSTFVDVDSKRTEMFSANSGSCLKSGLELELRFQSNGGSSVSEEIIVPEDGTSSVCKVMQATETGYQTPRGDRFNFGELRQRNLNVDDYSSRVEVNVNEEKSMEVTSEGKQRSEPNECVAPRLETAGSLDWKQLMKDDPNYMDSLQKSPVSYFMEEMFSGNSLQSTTALGNEKERERVYDTIFRLPWRCELVILSLSFGQSLKGCLAYRCWVLCLLRLIYFPANHHADKDGANLLEAFNNKVSYVNAYRNSRHESKKLTPDNVPSVYVTRSALLTPQRVLLINKIFLNPLMGQFKRPSVVELSDFGCFLIMTCGVTLLQRTDISLIYHMIRGQGTIKLYVVYNVLEIFDKLCQSIGGDVLQTLFHSAEGLANSSPENVRFWIWRFVSDQALAVAGSIVHSFILLAQAITFSTCIVAHNNALLALLVSNNFSEIKSNVFKRFSKENIRSLVYFDSIERFHISAFVLFVLAQNILEAEGPWFETFLLNALLVYICEMFIDIIKHSFLAKFNDVKPIAYSEFLEDLCQQVLNKRSEDAKKNLTFIPLAPACVVIRVLTPLFATLLPCNPLPWRPFLIVILIGMNYAMLTSLKVMIGMGLRKFSAWYIDRCQRRKHHLHAD